MKRYWLCLGAALGLLGAMVPGRALELELKYKMKPGQVLKYHDWLVMASINSREEMPEGARLQLASEVFYQQRVVSLEDGVFELENRTLSGTRTFRFGEEEESDEIEERGETVSLNERGKVLSRTELNGDEEEEEEDDSLLGLNPLGVLDEVYENLLFPPKAVSVGQKWTDQATLELSSQNQVSVVLDSQITRLVKVQGRPCAEIKTHFVVPLQGQEEDPVNVSVDGQLVGDLILYFAYEEGIDVVHFGEINVILNTDMEMMGQTRENVTRSKIRLKTVLEEIE